VRLAVRLTPRAGRSALDGVMIGPDRRPVLRLRVAAPPVEGAANAALTALLTSALRLRRSDVEIMSGETGRLKMVQLRGDGPAIAARLAAWIASAPQS
jgi:uncharacterized protein YggU (UPF0235/DUF167 family)